MRSCLIVEDSEPIREIIARIITALEFKPVEAESAAAGIEACKSSPVDVVLLDWDLPSFGALDFLKGFAELPEDERPPIILCATENDPQQFALARAAGAKGHILKPFETYEIAQALADVGLGEDEACVEPEPAAKPSAG